MIRTDYIIPLITRLFSNKKRMWNTDSSYISFVCEKKETTEWCKNMKTAQCRRLVARDNSKLFSVHVIDQSESSTPEIGVMMYDNVQIYRLPFCKVQNEKDIKSSQERFEWIIDDIHPSSHTQTKDSIASTNMHTNKTDDYRLWVIRGCLCPVDAL